MTDVIQSILMNLVCDTETSYLAKNTKATVLAELIGDILGSAKAGKRLMDKLVLSGEETTPQNTRDRLRLALSTSQIPGITAKQAQRLKAVWKLVEELYFDQTQTGVIVDDPSVAAEVFSPMSWKPIEQFGVLSLDVQLRIISAQIISVGTATETLAHPRDVFSSVLRAGGTRCMVAHNHPSGNLEASKEDIALTEQLLQGGKALGIPMLDHLIVSRGNFVSIRQMTDLWVD